MTSSAEDAEKTNFLIMAKPGSMPEAWFASGFVRWTPHARSAV